MLYNEKIMTLQWTPFTSLFIIGLVVNTYVLSKTWPRRTRPGVFEFSIVFASLALWNLAALIRASIVAFSLQVFLANFIQATSVYLAVSLFLALMRFNEVRFFAKTWVRWIFWAVATALAAFLITDQLHMLSNTPAQFVDYYGVRVPKRAPGPYYWTAYIVPAYTLLAIGLGSLAVTARRMPKRQFLLIMLGVLAPLAFNAVTILNLTPLFQAVFDLTPFVTTFTAVIAIWALFQIRFTDVFNVETQNIVEMLTDGVLVVDRNNIITQNNSVARMLLGSVVEIGENLSDVFPVLTLDNKEEHLITVDDKTVSVTIKPLDADKTIDRLITVRDMTERLATDAKIAQQLSQFQVQANLSQVFLTTDNEPAVCQALQAAIRDSFNIKTVEILLAEPPFTLTQLPETVRLKSTDGSMVIATPRDLETCFHTDEILIEDSQSRLTQVKAHRLATGRQILGVVEVDHTAEFTADEQLLLTRIAQQGAEMLEKLRLENAQQQSRIASEALQNATQMLTTAKQTDVVLQNILAAMRKAINFDFGAIAITQDTHVEIVALTGETSLDTTQRQYKPDGHCIIEIAFAQDGVFSIQAEEEPRTYSFLNQPVSGNWLVTPLESQGRRYGVLIINNVMQRIFQGSDKRILQAMARQAALAIINSQNVEAYNTQSQQLQKVLDLNTALRSINTIDEVLQMGLDASQDLMSAAAGCVWQRAKDDEWLEMCAGDPITVPPTQMLKMAIGAGRTIADAAKDGGYNIYLPMQFVDVSEAVIQLNTTVDVLADKQLEVLNQLGQVITSAIETASIRDVLEGEVAARTEKLAIANAQLQSADALKSRFVSDMSHDLRTPLTNLKLWMGMLAKSPAHKIPRITGILDKQISLLDELVQSVHTISELDLGEVSTEQEALDLNTLIAARVTQAQASNTKPDVHIQFTATPDLPIATGTKPLLELVIDELIENAVNYTTTGAVTVSTAFDAAHAEALIIVADTGVGISPAEQDHIFDRFYRGDNAAQSDIIGSGLGLSIVEEILKRHQARITLESAPEVGSTFTVRLPLATEKAGVA